MYYVNAIYKMTRMTDLNQNQEKIKSIYILFHVEFMTEATTMKSKLSLECVINNNQGRYIRRTDFS